MRHPAVSRNKYCDCKCKGKHTAQLSLDSYLTEGNFYPKNKQLPNWLKGYFRDKAGACEICGINEWMGKKIVLDIDHIDGDYRNNTPDNLRAICQNCHAQTSTYKNKNKGKGRGSR